ncbi:TetR family transcriptional regulator [Frigoribacterium sp. CFBP 8754]|uniref:TetR family transcriptional regulator n=1 Tax=unclassified Frigoribacterium TaxID=2627005 RepID=UPI0016246FA6|nr:MULTISPECIES: TetR family transcriptional regulator [unclassified Frigoribacterium]MBD8661463.1 TetR family transcriptional regulator [Frigoribacterium sp. CFBP 8754]MBD8729446.1 TetR family transcriptional regulator [Frigoribacterium sp. CFBP 13707]QNE43778.1 TetR family transcriptional regulator [Frigoribacterium sp. NBH87]
MAHDANETRRRILEAATAEFSARGLAGARVDRISAAAGCSKERLYAHFGDKEALFTTVLNLSFAELGAAAAVPYASAEEFAVALFDHLAEHPENHRLLSWARLEDTHDWQASFAVLQETRDASIDQLDRVGAVRATPWGGDDLFAVLLSIASAWVQLPGLEGAPAATTGRDEQREIVREAVRRLVRG